MTDPAKPVSDPRPLSELLAPPEGATERPWARDQHGNDPTRPNSPHAENADLILRAVNLYGPLAAVALAAETIVGDGPCGENLAAMRGALKRLRAAAEGEGR